MHRHGKRFFDRGARAHHRDLALDWSLGFDAAVGEAVYVDTDGDGLDEVIVSVADG